MSVPKSSASAPSSSVITGKKAMESAPAGSGPRAAAGDDSTPKARSTGPLRLLGSLLLFPFWLLWMVLKGSFILLSLPFGGWRRLFKSKKSEEEDAGVVEKKLKNLSSEQQTIQTRMNKRAALWKSVSRYMLMYSALAEILVTLVVMTLLRPAPPMPSDDEDDIYLPELWLEKLQRWVMFVGPLLLVPTFTALLYTAAGRIIRARDSKDLHLLAKLEEQRKGHLEALKEKTGFYQTVELLKKYDPAAALQAAKDNQAGARGGGAQPGLHQARQVGPQAGRQHAGQMMGPQGQRQMGWAGAGPGRGGMGMGVGPGAMGPGGLNSMAGAGVGLGPGGGEGEPRQGVGRATVSSTGWPTPTGSPHITGRGSHHAAQSLPGSPSRSEARAQPFEYPMMPGADVSRGAVMSGEAEGGGGGAPPAPEEKEATGTVGGAAAGSSPGGATLRRRTVGGGGKSLRRTSSLLDGAVNALAGDILKDTDSTLAGTEAELQGGQESLAFGQSPKLGLQPQLRQRHGKGPGVGLGLGQGQWQEDASLASAQGVLGGAGEGGGRRVGEGAGASHLDASSPRAPAPGEEEEEDFGPGFRAAAAFGEVLHSTWSTGGKKKGWNRDSLIGWLAGMLVGEDPRQCYALICRKCCAHNGLARPEDFPYLSYVCPQCHYFNKAEGQRPERQQPQVGPKAEETSTTNSGSGTGSEAGQAGAGTSRVPGPAPGSGTGAAQTGASKPEGRALEKAASRNDGASSGPSSTPLESEAEAEAMGGQGQGRERAAGEGEEAEREAGEAEGEGELETPGLEGTITAFLDSFLAEEGMEGDDLFPGGTGSDLLGGGEVEGEEGEDELQVQEAVREVAAAAPAKGLTKQRLAAVLKSLEDS